MNESPEPLLTRKRVAELIRERIGIHMTPHMIAVACMKGRGPQPAAKHGRVFLYEQGEALRWGWSLVEPIGEASGAA